MLNWEFEEHYDEVCEMEREWLEQRYEEEMRKGG